MKQPPEDERIYILSEEKPARAVIHFGVPLIAGMFVMVLNRIFGFNGMIWAQPLTELIMMIVSVTLLLNVLKASEEHPVI